MTHHRVQLNNGNVYVADADDPRVLHAQQDSLALVITCKTIKARRQMASEARAWGARVFEGVRSFEIQA